MLNLSGGEPDSEKFKTLIKIAFQYLEHPLVRFRKQMADALYTWSLMQYYSDNFNIGAVKWENISESQAAITQIAKQLSIKDYQLRTINLKILNK